MRIKIDRKSRQPMYWQIADAIKRAILNGELADGVVLPSERGLAGQLEVHRNTVIRAYHCLEEMELVVARQGVGYMVARGTEHHWGDAAHQAVAPRRGWKQVHFSGEEPAEEHDRSGEEVRRSNAHGAGSGEHRSRPRPVNWRHMIKDDYLDMKEEFDAIFSKFYEGEGISFSAGMPPFVYTEEELATDIADLLKESEMLPAYAAPYQGDPDLRKQCREFLRTKGIRCKASEIQVLSETNQALDFIVTTLLEPGDCVIIEEPCSPDVYRGIELAGCFPITMPVDGDGMMTEGLADIVEKRRPKFIYVNSSYQDPTGNVMTVERRRNLLDVSARFGVPIIEEDGASELYYEDSEFPTLKSMDEHNNVVYIYSFALTFVPGISVAVVVGDPVLIHAMQYLVSVRVISIGWLTQRLVARYLKNGKYRAKIDEMVVHNRQNRDIMCAALDELRDIGVEYTKPRGGVYIWVKLPDGLDAEQVVRRAAKEKLAVVPGNVFYPLRNAGRDHVRLNYSYESTEWLLEGVHRFTKLLRTMYMESVNLFEYI